MSLLVIQHPENPTKPEGALIVTRVLDLGDDAKGFPKSLRVLYLSADIKRDYDGVRGLQTKRWGVSGKTAEGARVNFHVYTWRDNA